MASVSSSMSSSVASASSAVLWSPTSVARILFGVMFLVVVV